MADIVLGASKKTLLKHFSRRFKSGAARFGTAALVSSIMFAPDASAHDPSSSATSTLPSIEVIGNRRDNSSPENPVNSVTGSPDAPESEPVSSASQKNVSGEEVNARPFSRPAEALEVVPGLMITQHSGEGKANQYFLRGVNLDHGTDLAISVDGMPVNMRTHGHGQGWADLNFQIPELIESVNIKKGPYFADEGDFASVGAVHVNLIDSIAKSTLSTTIGSLGYRRMLGITSTKAGDGTLLIAGEANANNGPWDNPDKVRKLNSVVRYTQGTADNGFSLTGMAYSNSWNATDQIPARAISQGLVGLYGALDPTDGGRSNRFSISGQIKKTEAEGTTKVNFYVIKSSLDLYSNFTYFLNGASPGAPLNGDQFHQRDSRVVGGLNASHTFNHTFAGLPMETEVGIQNRYDSIRVGLSNTVQRQFLSGTRDDKVQEASTGLFIQNTVHWTSWLRTIVGYRGDFYATNVDSLLTPANAGKATSSIGSPKASIVFGPFAKTEFFINAGEGFHSNDARGVTIRVSPTDTSEAVSSSPFLVKTRGAEVGVRTKIIPGLESSLSLFLLDSASEILFVGDAGNTEPSRPSRRYGVEWTNHYQPTSWLAFDGDIAVTHARFRGTNPDQAAAYADLATHPEAQIGNAPGNYIPGAPNMVASAVVKIGEQTGWFGALRYRYFGPRPLTEDGAFVSPATGLLNGQVGYRFENGWRVQLDAFNLTDSKSDQISYAYGSLLKTDALFTQCRLPPPARPPAAVCETGVMDRVLHPVEPFALRLTVAGQF